MLIESLSSGLSDGGMTDDLVERAKEGDTRAYNQLFLRLETRLQFYIRLRLGRLLRAQLDVLDVLQETYLQAHKSFESFKAQGEGAFCRWMYRIIDHRIRDLAQHAKAQKRRPADAQIQGPDALASARAEHGTPSACFIAIEDQERLLKALDSLADDEREAIVLRYFQELTLEAIAELMNRSEPGVRRLLGRARLQLGKLLKSAAE